MNALLCKWPNYGQVDYYFICRYDDAHMTSKKGVNLERLAFKKTLKFRRIFISCAGLNNKRSQGYTIYSQSIFTVLATLPVQSPRINY